MTARGQGHGILLLMVVPVIPVTPLIANIRSGGQSKRSTGRAFITFQQNSPVVTRRIHHAERVAAGFCGVKRVADPLTSCRPTDIKPSEFLGNPVELAVVPAVLRIAQVNVYLGGRGLLAAAYLAGLVSNVPFGSSTGPPKPAKPTLPTVASLFLLFLGCPRHCHTPWCTLVPMKSKSYALKPWWPRTPLNQSQPGDGATLPERLALFRRQVAVAAQLLGVSADTQARVVAAVDQIL
jgi:hypothetical protein